MPQTGDGRATDDGGRANNGEGAGGEAVDGRQRAYSGDYNEASFGLLVCVSDVDVSLFVVEADKANLGMPLPN